MDEVKRVAPKFIDKHYVLNKDGKGIRCLFIALLLHYSDYVLFLLCYASMQSGYLMLIC